MTQAFKLACLDGNMAGVLATRGEERPARLNTLFTFVCANGHLEVVQFLHNEWPQTKKELDHSLWSIAQRPFWGESVEKIVNWLADNGAELDVKGLLFIQRPEMGDWAIGRFRYDLQNSLQSLAESAIGIYKIEELISQERIALAKWYFRVFGKFFDVEYDDEFRCHAELVALGEYAFAEEIRKKYK